MTERVRTAVLISGRGSNMAALIGAAKNPNYPAEIVLVLSNAPDAGGLNLARAAGVEALAVDHRPFGKDRAAHEAALNVELEARHVELIALAGYMRVLTGDMTRRWAGRMINIHPSLLPNFPGLNTHARALAAGHTRHGATVHWVVEGVDEGEPIAQTQVDVLPGDTEDTLAARVLAVEHQLYVQGLAVAAEVLRRGLSRG
ncbi:phosphoribosylglycinamide formyltransferase [soil metagenome]